MIPYLQRTAVRVTEAIVPEVIRTSVSRMLSDVIADVDQIYRGPVSDYSKVGTEFLKSRAIFPHQSKLKCAQQIMFYGIIASVGILLTGVMNPFAGYFVAVGSGLFAVSAVQDHRQGSHLKKAITELLDKRDWKEVTEQQTTVFSYDKANQVASFRLSDKTWEYYVGSGFCPQGKQWSMEATQVTAIWNKLHPVSV
jgi:hypothetical protein